MSNTKLEFNPKDDKQFAVAYDQKGDVMPPLSWWRNLPAAGYIKSDVQDMLNYLQLNFNEKNKAIRLAHKPQYKVSDEGASEYRFVLVY